MTMRLVVLLCRSKTRENYEVQISYFGLTSSTEGGGYHPLKDYIPAH